MHRAYHTGARPSFAVRNFPAFGFPRSIVWTYLRGNGRIKRWACHTLWLRSAPGGIEIYAVIRSGGKQYRVERDQLLDVDRIDGEVGSTVELKDVLMIGGNGDVQVGTPIVEDAVVEAEIVEHARDKKLRVFKYKNKTRYRRRIGHRTHYTRLAIKRILQGGKEAVSAETEEKPKAKRPARRTKKKPEPKAEAPEATAEAAATEAEAEAPAPEAKAEAPEAEQAAPEAEAATETEAKPKRTARRTTKRKTEEPEEGGAEASTEEKKPARRRSSSTKSSGSKSSGTTRRRTRKTEEKPAEDEAKEE